MWLPFPCRNWVPLLPLSRSLDSEIHFAYHAFLKSCRLLYDSMYNNYEGIREIYRVPRWLVNNSIPYFQTKFQLPRFSAQWLFFTEKKILWNLFLIKSINEKTCSLYFSHSDLHSLSFSTYHLLTISISIFNFSKNCLSIGEEIYELLFSKSKTLGTSQLYEIDPSFDSHSL